MFKSNVGMYMPVLSHTNASLVGGLVWEHKLRRQYSVEGDLLITHVGIHIAPTLIIIVII